LSTAQKIEAIIGALIIVIGGAAIFYGLWAVCWEIYDHVCGHCKRIKNRRIDAAHVTGQFHTPTFSQRDFK
jgi:phosphate/sulfate permease